MSKQKSCEREKNGTYTVYCSALRVYTVGETLEQAKQNFEEALDLHLSVLKEKATEAFAETGPC